MFFLFSGELSEEVESPDGEKDKNKETRGEFNTAACNYWQKIQLECLTRSLKLNIVLCADVFMTKALAELPRIFCRSFQGNIVNIDIKLTATENPFYLFLNFMNDYLSCRVSLNQRKRWNSRAEDDDDHAVNCAAVDLNLCGELRMKTTLLDCVALYRLLKNLAPFFFHLSLLCLSLHSFCFYYVCHIFTWMQINVHYSSPPADLSSLERRYDQQHQSHTTYSRLLFYIELVCLLYILLIYFNLPPTCSCYKSPACIILQIKFKRCIKWRIHLEGLLQQVLYMGV